MTLPDDLASTGHDQFATPAIRARRSIVDWARRVQSIAQNGLTYTEGTFDRERYVELREIAAEMLAACTGDDLSTITGRLLAENGYATPKVDVRGAVFNQKAEILLVREASDGLWTLPGGWADAGDTSAGAIVREIEEESGFRTRAVKVLGFFDRDHQGHPPLQWHVFKVFIRCEIIGGEARTSHETTEVGFFGETDIPPLSLGRVLPQQIRRLYDHYRDPTLPSDFD